MSLSTTKPPQVSDLDWTTIDPLRSMTLGKSLAARGYVIWRKERFEWIVISPTESGHHETVYKSILSNVTATWWMLLKCTCQNGSNPEGPCVHKCAVHTHATVPSEYRFYTEG